MTFRSLSAHRLNHIFLYIPVRWFYQTLHYNKPVKWFYLYFCFLVREMEISGLFKGNFCVFIWYCFSSLFYVTENSDKETQAKKKPVKLAQADCSFLRIMTQRNGETNTVIQSSKPLWNHGPSIIIWSRKFTIWLFIKTSAVTGPDNLLELIVTCLFNRYLMDRLVQNKVGKSYVCDRLKFCIWVSKFRLHTGTRVQWYIIDRDIIINLCDQSLIPYI